VNERDAIESLADVQRLLLPQDPRIGGLRYATHYQPAAIAAGDYYDLMVLNDAVPASFIAERGHDAWGAIVADVSGHGPAAAMEAVQFDAILRTYQGDEPPEGPAGALTYANRYFFSRRPRRHFLTVFAGRYRPDLGQLQFCSAGHHPALLRRGDLLQRIGEEGDIPLGIDRDYRFHNHCCDMGPGDILVLCTDGVLDAQDSQGVAFGIDRLTTLVRRSPADPEVIRDRVVRALRQHQGGTTGRDDQTLLVLQPVDD